MGLKRVQEEEDDVADGQAQGRAGRRGCPVVVSFVGHACAREETSVSRAVEVVDGGRDNLPAIALIHVATPQSHLAAALFTAP